MRIASNVEMLEIKGAQGTLYPVLTWGGKELALIDTALPGQTDALKEAVREAGYAFENITTVILTHHDLDHIGSAMILSGLGAKIFAHELETPYLQGDQTSIRLTDMESRFDELSEGERAFYERAKKGAPYFYVHVDTPLKDGDRLDICGGISVIHTPGHTPGHIALLMEETNILVAGDAANIAEGKLVGADPKYTRDIEQAKDSFNEIIGCNPSSVVCYHGGLYTK